MRSELLVAVSLIASSACGPGTDFALMAASRPETWRSFEGSAIRFELTPPVPSQIALGETVSFALQARFESGDLCRLCQATWTSSKPEIAAISAEDPCSHGSCSAQVEGLAAGKAVLTVDVCQSYESDCREMRITVTVSP